MTFIKATNVVASRMPEHQPTGMPTARAKIFSVGLSLQVEFTVAHCGGNTTAVVLDYYETESSKLPSLF